MSTHRIVLKLSEGEYGRLAAKAAAGRLEAGEWALQAVRVALDRRDGKRDQARRSREAGFELLALLAGSSTPRPA